LIEHNSTDATRSRERQPAVHHRTLQTSWELQWWCQGQDDPWQISCGYPRHHLLPATIARPQTLKTARRKFAEEVDE